jgi:hypothetical protein
MLAKRRVPVWIALTAIVFAGPATPAPIVSKPVVVGIIGNVRVGPELKLVDRKAGVKAVMGPDGHVDLIVVSREKQKKATQLRFSRIGIQSDVVAEEETIATIDKEFFENFDAALDSSGNLHLVIEGNHYTHRASGWSDPAEGPACRRLILAADTLVCMLVVNGADVGSPRRWEWNFFGGPMAAIVLPSHADTQKIVLTRQTATGWSDWSVVDPQTKFDVGEVALAASNTGTVHLIYIPMSNIFGTPAEHPPRYARIEPANTPPSAPQTSSDSGAAGKHHVVASITGQDVAIFGSVLSLAVDPTSGLVFGAISDRGLGLVHTLPFCLTIHDGAVSSPISIGSFRGSPFATATVAPAGKDRFHVILAVTTGHFKQISHLAYLTYADGKWSEPIPLGEAAGYQGSTFGLQLVSDSAGHAFLTWIDNVDSKPRGRAIALMD